MNSLARVEPAPVPAFKQWTPEQVEMATRSFATDCTMPELEVFAEVAARKGLDPWLGQIVAIKRGGKMIIQETEQGYLAVAERTGLYGGYRGPWWRTKEGPWDDVWLEDDYPAAAKILVIRKDWTEPAAGVAAWKSNVQFFRNKAGQAQIVDIWQNRPDEMLAKCANVRALRRAFNKELALAGISTRDMTDAQVVTLEAKRAGLDDDQRHAVIAEVTGGRTSSSTALTDDETIEVRQEIARIAAETEPEDAEVVGPMSLIEELYDTVTRRANKLDPAAKAELVGWCDANGIPVRDRVANLPQNQVQAVKEWLDEWDAMAAPMTGGTDEP